MERGLIMQFSLIFNKCVRFVFFGLMALGLSVGCGGGGGGGSGGGASPVSDGGTSPGGSTPSTPESPAQPSQPQTQSIAIHAQNWMASSMFVALFGFKGEFLTEKEIFKKQSSVGPLFFFEKSAYAQDAISDFNLELTSQEKEATAFAVISSTSIKDQDSDGIIDAIVITFSKTQVIVDEKSKTVARELKERGGFIISESNGLELNFEALEAALAQISDQTTAHSTMTIAAAIHGAKQGSLSPGTAVLYTENSIIQEQGDEWVDEVAGLLFKDIKFNIFMDEAANKEALLEMKMGFNKPFGIPNPYISGITAIRSGWGDQRLYEAGLGPIVQGLDPKAQKICLSYKSDEIKNIIYPRLTKEHFGLYKYSDSGSIKDTNDFDISQENGKTCIAFHEPFDRDTFYTLHIMLSSSPLNDLFSTFKTCNCDHLNSTSEYIPEVIFKTQKQDFMNYVSEQGLNPNQFDSMSGFSSDANDLYVRYRFYDSSRYSSGPRFMILPRPEATSDFKSQSFALRLMIPIISNSSVWTDSTILSQKGIYLSSVADGNPVMLEYPMHLEGMPFYFTRNSVYHECSRPEVNISGGALPGVGSIEVSGITLTDLNSKVTSYLAEHKYYGYNSSLYPSSLGSGVFIDGNKLKLTVQYDLYPKEAICNLVTYESDKTFSDMVLTLLRGEKLQEPKPEPEFFEGPHYEDFLDPDPGTTLTTHNDFWKMPMLMAQAYAQSEASDENYDPQDPYSVFWNRMGLSGFEFSPPPSHMPSVALKRAQALLSDFEYSSPGYMAVRYTPRVQQFLWNIQDAPKNASTVEEKNILNGIFGESFITQELRGDEFYERVSGYMKQNPKHWVAMEAIYTIHHENILQGIVNREWALDRYYNYVPFFEMTPIARNACSLKMRNLRDKISQAASEYLNRPATGPGHGDLIVAYFAYVGSAAAIGELKGLEDASSPISFLAEWDKEKLDPSLKPEDMMSIDAGHCFDALNAVASVAQLGYAVGPATKYLKGMLAIEREAKLVGALEKANGKLVVHTENLPSRPLSVFRQEAPPRKYFNELLEVSSQGSDLAEPTPVVVRQKTFAPLQKRAISSLIELKKEGFSLRAASALMDKAAYLQYRFQQAKRADIRYVRRGAPLRGTLGACVHSGDEVTALCGEFIRGSNRIAVRKLLNNIKDFQYGSSEMAQEAGAEIKKAILSLVKNAHDIDKEDILTRVVLLIDSGKSAQWESIISLLESKGVLTTQDRVHHLIELAIGAGHEVDHFERFSIGKKLYIRKQLAALRPRLSLEQMQEVEQFANSNASLAQVIGLFEKIKNPNLAPDLDSLNTLVTVIQQNITFVMEKSAYRAEQKFLKMLRDDSLLQDLIEETSQGGLRLSQKAKGAIQGEESEKDVLDYFSGWFDSGHDDLTLDLRITNLYKTGEAAQRVKAVIGNKNLDEMEDFLDVAVRAGGW